MAYGMKDAADLLLVDLATKTPALFIDYANATSSEWSAESVFATKKGSRAIRWDDDRQGTLTIDTEMFDYGLLAMVMGSKIKDGSSNVFGREEFTLKKDRKIKLAVEGEIDTKSISVIKLRGNTQEHEGVPLENKTLEGSSLPDRIVNLTVSVNDKNAKVTFDKADKAETYAIYRDGNKVADVATNTFTESGLTPETSYVYTVAAVNDKGFGAKSAEVKVKTAAEGTVKYTPVQPTEEAKKAAESNVAEFMTSRLDAPTFTVSGKDITLSEQATEGSRYAVYYMETVQEVRTLTIGADTFPSNYEIFANATIREEDGHDEIVQMHYKNAKPQSNFTLTQSATEPTSLSIVFDLFPVKGILAEMKIIQ